MRRARWSLLALLLSSAVAQLGAQTPPSSDSLLEARVRALASELRCPVCQGESIQDSPAELAQEMKAIVREQLAAGRSSDEVKSYFVEKYGEWILLRPKAQGWNVIVYALPVAALLFGAAVIARATRRWSARDDTKATDDVQPRTADT